jgi:ribonuclease VapC
VSVCLDSFALLAWFQDEPGAALVEEHLAAAAAGGEAHCYISNINLGEVYYRIARLRGRDLADRFWSGVTRPTFPVTPIDATRRRIREAAALKAAHPIAFGDAFAVQLALERRAPLLTGDPEIGALRDKEPLDLIWLPAPR